MNSRQTDTVTRVDIRIPNHLYSRIQSIAMPWSVTAHSRHRHASHDFKPTFGRN